MIRARNTTPHPPEALEGAAIHPAQLLVPSQVLPPVDLRTVNTYAYQAQLAVNLRATASAHLDEAVSPPAANEPPPWAWVYLVRPL